jgi:hypothetical protein
MQVVILSIIKIDLMIIHLENGESVHFANLNKWGWGVETFEHVGLV